MHNPKILLPKILEQFKILSLYFAQHFVQYIKRLRYHSKYYSMKTILSKGAFKFQLHSEKNHVAIELSITYYYDNIQTI